MSILLLTGITTKCSVIWEGGRNWFWRETISRHRWFRRIIFDFRNVCFRFEQLRPYITCIRLVITILFFFRHTITQILNLRIIRFIYESESEAGCRFVLQWRHDCRSHSLDGAAHTLLWTLKQVKLWALFLWDNVFEYSQQCVNYYFDTNRLLP